MTTFQRILMIAALCAMAALPVARPAAAQSTLSPDDASAIRRIETYLNGLSTVQARFTQISEVGGVAQGTFYLSRPGRMRIEYDPPIPYLYIADGIWLTFW
ncbi:MAG: outer membrane lipoprotein carrier protein LolA, partial [Alphaproteobacteria bacterium]